MLLNIRQLMDDAKCYEVVRELRWPDGVKCPACDSGQINEVHVNTIEGFWLLLRSWLRPHRGISQEQLLLYLAFFEFAHNIRHRGKALLASLLTLLLAPCNPG